MIDLETLKLLKKQITHGPWHSSNHAYCEVKYVHAGPYKDTEVFTTYRDKETNEANTAFVCLVRNALPEIIREIQAGRALAQEIEETRYLWDDADIDAGEAFDRVLQARVVYLKATAA